VSTLGTALASLTSLQRLTLSSTIARSFRMCRQLAQHSHPSQHCRS